MISMLSGVGSRMSLIVASVLAVGLIFFLMIQYGKNIEAQNQREQELQEQIETRERIDEDIRNSPTDPADALEWLRQR